MKTIEKKYYVCQYCGRSSQSEQKISECERSHRLLTGDCTWQPRYGRSSSTFGCPQIITITFPDGTTADYDLIIAREART